MSYTRTTRTTRTVGGGAPQVTTTTTHYGGQPDQNRGDMNSHGGGDAIRPAVSQPTETRRKRQTQPFPGQSFEQIRDHCLRKGVLWEDPEFPAVDESIFYSRKPPRPFVWKRPPELVDNAKLFVGGASRFDVKQGELGDCWLLAAVASLTINKDLLHAVVPEDQWFEQQYAGVFRFRFWQAGTWVEVCVDDRLPTYYDRLVFLHSDAHNEFWTALLEKAYAKLMGSYESLKGGSSSEAMEDFTGGVTEMYDLRKAPKNLFTIMSKAFERRSMMGCSIDADPSQTEAELANGLICGHAYSITAVKMVEINTARMSGKIPLVRVRNPWGNEAEWKGAWSDKSREWNLVSEEERKALGIDFEDDGEFWMAFKDFETNFQKLEICNLDPDSLGEEEIGSAGKTWKKSILDGEWRRRVSAGGCRNFLDTFWTNPQFRITVSDPDEDEDDLCTVLIALMQKGRRKKRKEGADLLTMGYAIYQLKDPNAGVLDINFFKYTASFAKSPTFINLREICGRHQFPPGTYVIIPSTFEPNQDGEFLLRIFTESPNVSGEVDEETSMADVKPPQELRDQVEAQEGPLRESFKRVAGEDMEIDAYELQNIVNLAFKKDFKFDGFSIETCRSMVAMKDEDQSGMLGFDEFKELWQDLLHWKAAFRKHDKDKSGTFNSYELRAAFSAVGFKVSNKVFSSLVMRYGQKDGTVQFDDFVLCAVRLRHMFDMFEQNRRGSRAEFSLDDFVMLSMYS